MKSLGEDQAALYRSLPEDKEDAMKSLHYKLQFQLIQTKMSAAYQEGGQGRSRHRSWLSAFRSVISPRFGPYSHVMRYFSLM